MRLAVHSLPEEKSATPFDRIARQHPSHPYRYQLANGRSAKLFDYSALYREPWVVVSALRDPLIQVPGISGNRNDLFD